MNLIFKSMMVAIATLAFLSILILSVRDITGYDPALSTDINSPSFRAMYIDSVVATFTGVLADLKEHNEIANPENLYKKREQLKVRNASNIMIAVSGEVVFISDELGIVVVIHPTVNSSNNVHGWSCSTYPQVTSKTLCSMLR